MPSKCILVTSKAITGYLNVDDVDGFGPQHSFANIINEPQIFKTKVHMFSYHADSIVKWQLEAKVEGVSLWTETGTFDPASADVWSAELDVALTSSTCVQYLSLSNTGGRQLLDDCCPPEQYEDRSPTGVYDMGAAGRAYQPDSRRSERPGKVCSG